MLEKTWPALFILSDFVVKKIIGIGSRMRDKQSLAKEWRQRTFFLTICLIWR